MAALSNFADDGAPLKMVGIKEGRLPGLMSSGGGKAPSAAGRILIGVFELLAQFRQRLGLQQSPQRSR
jgi:hypothetical protein